jgi:DNA polymerase-3 subunit beta
VEKQVNEQGRQILRMVTTDGSRLSKVDYAGEGNLEVGLEEGVLIPKKGLAEAGRFLDTVGTVSVGFKNNHFIMKRDSETVVIRLLEGDFPKYGDILDSIVGVPIVMERQAFLMMLKRMSILASETYRAVVFHFTEDHLMIRSTNPDLGEAKEDMEIVYAGEPIEVAFNPRFFIEAINAMDDENIVMTMVDHEKPCLINGENDPGFLSVIMPMRI